MGSKSIETTQNGSTKMYQNYTSKYDQFCGPCLAPKCHKASNHGIKIRVEHNLKLGGSAVIPFILSESTWVKRSIQESIQLCQQVSDEKLVDGVECFSIEICCQLIRDIEY